MEKTVGPAHSHVYSYLQLPQRHCLCCCLRSTLSKGTGVQRNSQEYREIIRNTGTRCAHSIHCSLVHGCEAFPSQALPGADSAELQKVEHPAETKLLCFHLSPSSAPKVPYAIENAKQGFKDSPELTSGSLHSFLLRPGPLTLPAVEISGKCLLQPPHK